MVGLLAIFLITLGLGQLASTLRRLPGLSLVGANLAAGYSVGIVLLVTGSLLLPHSWWVLMWVLPMEMLTVIVLAIGGSLNPPPNPHRLFEGDHPAHAKWEAVQIPDGLSTIPGLLMRPSKRINIPGSAVCIVPGAGDTKTSFKWRLVETLLAAGLTVLTIDPPGHGDYHQRAMSYPDCLSVLPAALDFLRKQPDVTQTGVIGISLGGALALRSLAKSADNNNETAQQIAAVVIIATPTRLDYTQALFYRELWQTLFRAPSLSLLEEMSVRQARQTWNLGGYRSQHSTADLFTLLDPLKSLKCLSGIPTLLVYSRRDLVSSPQVAQDMRQAAPWADYVESKIASHVMLILTPSINQQIADWLKEQFRR